MTQALMSELYELYQRIRERAKQTEPGIPVTVTRQEARAFCEALYGPIDHCIREWWRMLDKSADKTLTMWGYPVRIRPIRYRFGPWRNVEVQLPLYVGQTILTTNTGQTILTNNTTTTERQGL